MTALRLLAACSFSLWFGLCACAAPDPIETEILYLSGTGPEDAVEWDFFCTAGRNSRTWSKIPVPSNWEQHGFGTYNYGGETNFGDGPLGHEQGLYRHRFTVPATWRGRVVRIVFDAAMTDTSVWINGQPAGPTHHGGFYRFHYDVSPLLRYGEENVLEVTVSKVSAVRSVNDAERAADYWVFGGIFRPVWLEAAPPRFIDWTAIDARADGSFLAHVYLNEPAPADGLRVTAQLSDAAGQAFGAPLNVTVEPGAAHATVRGTFATVRLWTAETPNLYRVSFFLEAAGGGRLHRQAERFGFRTIEVRENDGVYLNGTKIVLKGVNRHCFWPETARTVSRAQSYEDARLMKAANLNAVRMSHYPPDKHFLEACDELGLYVLDELAGWQDEYHTETGRRLIGQLVRRDVNHPSILFWNNGNEGGWNEANDGEFAKWDPQNRAVLHPWAISSGIDTNHYEDYASTAKLSAGPTIFMPTEFLHALYDGGAGAGLRDFWSVMSQSPTVAGGFIWVWADEGVVRTDRDGAIDNAGNLAPDGIVGPHREKEGSYFAVKEIWSPVQVLAPALDVSLSSEWDQTLSLKNDYAFTPLERCTIHWQLIDVDAAGRRLVAEGREPAPAAAPRRTAKLQLKLPEQWHAGSRGTAPARRLLHVTALDPEGQDLWTWSWAVGRPVAAETEKTARRPGAPAAAAARETATELVVSSDGSEWRFDRATGRLAGVRTGTRKWSLTNGPRFVAYLRKDRIFADIAGDSALTSLAARVNEAGATIVEATYTGALRRVAWEIRGATATLDYAYAFSGEVNVLGVQFDYPETSVRGKRWLGRGPYRVYQNRRDGGVLDFWQVAYNDPVPGETYAVPEFKGYFDAWSWLTLETTEGELTIENATGVPFHGLFRAKDGVKGLLDFPPLGVALLEVIPAQRDKFLPPERLGPSSQTPLVFVERTSRVVLRFE
jgi:hypothetical protein